MCITIGITGIHSEHAFTVMLVISGRDWPAYPQPRIWMMLDAWYWDDFMVNQYFNVGFLYAKHSSFSWSVFSADNQRFEGLHRDPGHSRAVAGSAEPLPRGGPGRHHGPSRTLPSRPAQYCIVTVLSPYSTLLYCTRCLQHSSIVLTIQYRTIL